MIILSRNKAAGSDLGSPFCVVGGPAAWDGAGHALSGEKVGLHASSRATALGTEAVQRSHIGVLIIGGHIARTTTKNRGGLYLFVLHSACQVEMIKETWLGGVEPCGV
jgi:hypothetical protein